MDNQEPDKSAEVDIDWMFDEFLMKCVQRQNALEGYLHKAQCEIADLQEAILWYTGKEAADLLREYRAANHPS